MRDPYDDFLAREEKAKKWLAAQPVCDVCGDHIQSEYMYLINGEKWCEDCIADCRKLTDEEVRKNEEI